jgi:hypothetical protein
MGEVCHLEAFDPVGEMGTGTLEDGKYFQSLEQGTKA